MVENVICIGERIDILNIYGNVSLTTSPSDIIKLTLRTPPIRDCFLFCFSMMEQIEKMEYALAEW